MLVDLNMDGTLIRLVIYHSARRCDYITNEKRLLSLTCTIATQQELENKPTIFCPKMKQETKSL